MAYYYLYEHRIPYNNVEDNYFAYWLDNRELVLINQPRTFPANEVAPFIDKKLRGERFSLMISNQNKSLLPQKKRRLWPFRRMVCLLPRMPDGLQP
ncbi:MAG: hypothetical protein HC912_10025 [Saprospiraceae bacterium]|nr:hypothetical protein [Saprospiraceae bacterium]